MLELALNRTDVYVAWSMFLASFNNLVVTSFLRACTTNVTIYMHVSSTISWQVDLACWSLICTFINCAQLRLNLCFQCDVAWHFVV
jgi:hypothetical protein